MDCYMESACNPTPRPNLMMNFMIFLLFVLLFGSGVQVLMKELGLS